MEINLSGKRALVTGGAQGIGLAVVKKLAACGAQVVALDVQEGKLKEAVKKIPGVETAVVNLSDWDSTLEDLKKIGRVHLVVNNAGVHYRASAADNEESGVDRVLNVNLKGVMAVCKHVINDWTSAGLRGSIVNIASVSANRADTIRPAYCASKAAVLQYTRCLALDSAPKGIRVNAVSPGLVETEMALPDINNPQTFAEMQRIIPMEEKIIDPEDIANAVAFLLCDKLARRITGVNLYVDAGQMLT